MSRGIHTKPNQGEKDEWLTPPSLIEALGPFDLDPCAPINRPWDTAEKHYTILDDGLKQPWDGRVFLNPPYGREPSKWLEKLHAHGNGIALVAVRSETSWWFDWIWEKADAVLFLKGRLYYYHVDGTKAKGNAGHGSALVAYGPNVNTLWKLGQEGMGKFVSVR